MDSSAAAERSQNGAASAATDDTSRITAERHLRPHLLSLAAYTPIEPFEILSERMGRDPSDIVKLDANENPYGPPPEVLQALGNMQFPNIYPDPQSRLLRADLSKSIGVPAENLLVGCGADELIDLLMRCTLDPGDSIVDCPPTFTMYAFDAAVNDARVITVPRLEDFRLDIEGIEAAVREQSPKLVFLTSPNNPDGSIIAQADLERVLALPTLVVLDEAYVDFSTEPSRLDWVLRHDNLVVLRTFSKSAGLAGMRVGYGAFPKGLIDYMWRAKQPYNVSVAAEVAARAALSNPAYLDEVRTALMEERSRLFKMLQTFDFLEPFPSQANFILCKVKGGREAKAVKEALMAEGIMVRYYSQPSLNMYVRISVGKPEHTDLLQAALSRL